MEYFGQTLNKREVLSRIGNIRQIAGTQKMVVTEGKGDGISRKNLSEILGINQSAVQKHIDTLKKKGIISRDSETTGYWRVLLGK